MNPATSRNGQGGFVLLSAVILIAFLVTLLATYALMTNAVRSTTHSTMESARGFYAAEAGLNLRFDDVRKRFEAYGFPAGAPPVELPGQLPCEGPNQGSGDLGCVRYDFQGRESITFMTADAANPVAIIVPPGEMFQNLRADEYRYNIESIDVKSDDVEAILNLEMLARLVPMFQFAAFYDKDLEILPGPSMTLDGPVHANGDLYMSAGNTLVINGQVTSAGTIYRGRKNDDCCSGTDVRVYDPVNPELLPDGDDGDRYALTGSDLLPWHGWVRSDVERVAVPPFETLEPNPGEVYWDNADLRIVLDLNGATPEVEVRDADGNRDDPATTLLDGCAGTAVPSSSFYNHREDKAIQMLDVDVALLLDCIQSDNTLMSGRPLDDLTHGGLVWHFTVDGPDSAGVNDYGVRVTNGADLDSSGALDPEVRGLTVVTDQAMYVQGNYNSTDKKPAAFLCDSLNVLSNAWDDLASAGPLAGRIASPTTINAAFLSGTDSTGGAEGTTGQGGAYNGGLENYPRFHEDWEDQTLTYRGSFVSLDRPRHVEGLWQDQSYDPPDRDWGYDTDFNDPANLPPLSPRFLYFRQEVFARHFQL